MNKNCEDDTAWIYTAASVTATSGVKLTFGVGTNVVLDLGGNTLTRTCTTTNSAINVVGGKLEIKNGTIQQTGTTNAYCLWTSPFVENGKKSELIVNNVTVKSNGGAISTCYTSGTPAGEAVVTVKGKDTVIECAGTALYAIKANCTINVEDGLITSSVAGSSTVTTGKVIQVQDPAAINISGGTFKNTTDLNPVDFYCVSGGKTTGTVTITGGTFAADPSYYCAEGYYANKLSSNEYVVESTTAAIKEDVVSDKVATGTSNITSGYKYVTGDVAYKTLAYAIEDEVNDTDVETGFTAPEDTVIVLMANNNEEIEIDKELTITKNGYKATNLSAATGYVLKETDTAYIVEEATEVTATIGASYDDGKGAETKTMRFFTVVDSLDYAEAGFEVATAFNSNNYAWKIALSEVYNLVTVNGTNYVAGDGKYILTGAIGDIPGTTLDTLSFNVKPYTKNAAGTVSYGSEVAISGK